MTLESTYKYYVLFSSKVMEQFVSFLHYYKCRCLPVTLYLFASFTTFVFSFNKKKIVYININNLLKIKQL